MRRTTTHRAARPLASLATLLAAVLVVVPGTSAVSPAAAAASPQRMYVAVNVATVSTNPGKARPVDKPALTNPAHPLKWLHDMTSDQRADLTDSNRTQTQALYGAPVLVLAHQGAWSQVVVPRQPTPRDARGYPGWIPTRQLTSNPSYAAAVRSRPFALVDRGITTGLFAGPKLRHRVLNVSMNTRLPVVGRTPKALVVATPNGRRGCRRRARTSTGPSGPSPGRPDASSCARRGPSCTSPTCGPDVRASASTARA